MITWEASSRAASQTQLLEAFLEICRILICIVYDLRSSTFIVGQHFRAYGIKIPTDDIRCLRLFPQSLEMGESREEQTQSFSSSRVKFNSLRRFAPPSAQIMNDAIGAVDEQGIFERYAERYRFAISTKERNPSGTLTQSNNPLTVCTQA